MLAAMAALYASGNDFANRLDSMSFSDLTKFSQGQLNTLEDDLNREKGYDPYLKGYGAYKAKIDEWAKAVEAARRGSFKQDSNSIPERDRPMDGRRVINMFEVKESQLLANPDAAHRFYAELQETKKSQSYKDQSRTKEQADKWINWLEDNGFGRESSNDSSAKLQHSVVERSNEYGGQRVKLPSGAVYDLSYVKLVNGGTTPIWKPSNDIAKAEAENDRNWRGHQSMDATHARVEKAIEGFR